jgi:XTP/dITP diphosphohydrolase
VQIILASANKGKVKEFKSWMRGFEVHAFSDVMEPFEIEENGMSFKENALIKARAVYEKLKDKSSIVISDDSGISVNALEHAPGIYSARYAGVGATSAQNLDKLIATLKQRGLKKAPAYYTAAIAIVCQHGEFCVHGWMFGNVIDTKRGDNGFGYDPIFVPLGHTETLGELPESFKEQFSHRANALELAQIILKTMKR